MDRFNHVAKSPPAAHIAFMFDIAWQELLLIAIVALLVIPPRDLPRAMAMAGRWIRRAKMLARDFQHGLDELTREIELAELKREAQEAARRASEPFTIDNLTGEPVRKIEAPPQPPDQRHE